ncbi:MAG: hypothetical protein ACFFDF_04705, partial [Candidatus Odinarchaeota archaeon]
AIHCNCSIEIRPLRDDEKAVKIKLRFIFILLLIKQNTIFIGNGEELAVLLLNYLSGIRLKMYITK